MCASQIIEPAVWFPTIRAGSGTDVFTERLVEGLRQRGIKAEISWLPHRSEYAPWTVAKPQPPAWANITHINTWLPSRFLPKQIPIVASIHSCVHDPTLSTYKKRLQSIYHRFWIRKMESISLRRAQSVVAVSQYTARQAQIVFGRDDIVVVTNAIDLNGPFHPEIRDLQQRPFRLLYVGNWTALKGVDLLAPIMDTLGEGFELYYTADRQQRHKHYRLPANSVCLGRLTDAHQLAANYRGADALIFPSKLEGFGLVALEAQACGLPVIATRGSSLPEVIEDGVTGLLCPQDDSYAFAAAVRELASNTRLWREMKIAGRHRTERLFDLESMTDEYLNVYRTTLAKELH